MKGVWVILLLSCGDASAYATPRNTLVFPGKCYFTVELPDFVVGLTPAGTGSRTVINPEVYGGTDYHKIQNAVSDAVGVSGAVVMHRVYDIPSQYINIINPSAAGIMITGGGLRRTASPVQTLVNDIGATDTCATVSGDASQYTLGEIVGVYASTAYLGLAGTIEVFTASGSQLCASTALGFTATKGAQLGYWTTDMITTSPTSTSGIIIDSVFFDGGNRWNHYTHDWSLANMVGLRGENIIRNSFFYDTPSENITSCGGLIEDNTAYQLQGSFIHKSCVTGGHMDTVRRNRVDGANAGTDAVMNHSEGLITFSAHADAITLYGNLFRNGIEGVYGEAPSDSGNLHASGDCYENFPRLITYIGVDTSTVSFGAIFDNVPH